MDTISRYWEIDLVRGIAILMMILFHTVFDLYFFRILPIDIFSGFWRYFAFSTASLFLLIVGISLTISHARTALTKSGYQLALKFVYRGAGIFLLGLLVTVCTWLFLKEDYIVFGILHLIGISVMISPLFFRFKRSQHCTGSSVDPDRVFFRNPHRADLAPSPRHSPRNVRVGGLRTALSLVWCRIDRHGPWGVSVP